MDSTIQPTSTSFRSQEDLHIQGSDSIPPHGVNAQILFPNEDFNDLHNITLLALSTNRNVRVTCENATGTVFLATFNQNTVQHFDHPLQASVCFARCIDENDCTISYSISGF